jgi:DNA-3-methyladenine glycosylase I
LKATERCPWALSDPLLRVYHDKEWGVHVREENILYEFLILEGAQAGLSWLTVLRKRENYRRVFDNFHPEKVALYKEREIRKLKQDPGIIRNELKLRSAVRNAKSFLVIQEEFGSFHDYAWRFVNGRPVKGLWKSQAQIPVTTRESEALSQDLKLRGFNFVGSTICYSFMQAVGMVNDHFATCFRAEEV